MHKTKLNIIMTIAILAVIILSFSSCSFFKQPDYFPLNQGSEWVYVFGSDELTFKVTGEETVNGKKCSIYEAVMKGIPSQREYYQKTDKELIAVMRSYGNGQIKVNLNPPETLMKFPLKTGDSWTWSGQLGNTEKVTFNFKVSKKEKITVPAGTFNSIKIEINGSTQGGKSISTERWYAPNVGMIKDISKFGPINLTAELKSYKIGK